MLIVTASAARRGAEIEAVSIASALRDHHVDASIVALIAGSGSPLDIEVLGTRPLGVRTLGRLRRRSMEVDVVIAWGSQSLPACALAVPDAKPWVYRSIGQPSAWVRSTLHRSITGIQFRRASAVVALWEDAADEIKDLYGVPSSQVSVIPNSRDTTRFRVAPNNDIVEFRRRLDIRDDSAAVLALGALSPEKNLRLAIDATLTVADAHLLIAGDGPDLASLRAYSSAVDPSGRRVRFLGAVADPRLLLAAADVLVISSTTEGMPGCAVEALLSGLPVAAVPVGAIPEMLKDMPSAVVTEAATPVALGEAIRLAIATSNEARARSQARAELAYGSVQVSGQWAHLIRKLADAR